MKCGVAQMDPMRVGNPRKEMALCLIHALQRIQSDWLVPL